MLKTIESWAEVVDFSLKYSRIRQGAGRGVVGVKNKIEVIGK